MMEYVVHPINMTPDGSAYGKPSTIVLASSDAEAREKGQKLLGGPVTVQLLEMPATTFEPGILNPGRPI